MSANHTDQDHSFYKAAVSTIHNTYKALEYKPQDLQWTILASFFLLRQPDIAAGTSGEIKVISIATGTKCLPAARLSPRGEVIHDSHAEVLARRYALRWFLDEIHRVCSSSGEAKFESAWIMRDPDGRHYKLHDGIELNLYVSTVPCGDASTRFLASSQDAEMAALKDASASALPTLDPTTASRGRDDYARLGALRTKPGRADSPPTECMSCSDKIARWNVLGVQGALGAYFLLPIYITAVIIGEVSESARQDVREDCERAFWKRLGDMEANEKLPVGYSVRQPKIHFTDLPFVHSRTELMTPNTCVESFCYISDSSRTSEILINGLKRGVAPKHRYRDKSRPLICRHSMFEFVEKIRSASGLPPFRDPAVDNNRPTTYLELKNLSADYQTTKHRLVGEHGPFAGWVQSGQQWQNFTSDGDIQIPLSSSHSKVIGEMSLQLLSKSHQ